MGMLHFSRRDFVIGGGIGLWGFSSAAAATPGRIVRTQYGRVRGIRRHGAEVFLGLPYGASTEGARRFMPPVPPPSWSGVRDAVQLAQRSPQPGAPTYFHAGIGEYMTGGRRDELMRAEEPVGEDCLALNVLTPRADRRRRAVMMYIHGGGFVMGSGAALTLSERFVVEQDIVLVTVNHRLAGLGFAYLGGLSSKYAAGNPGMLDLVAALTWIKENIGAFGGDPDKVTIFGESGGGAKVALLMAMPQAAGLFRGAIIESGVAPNPLDPAEATERVRAFMIERGLDPANVDVLQTLPAEELLTLGNGAATNQTDLGRRLSAQVGPVADGRTLAANPWAEAPETAAHIPLMMGHCAAEASLFAANDPSVLTLDWAQLPGKLAEAVNIDAGALAPSIAAYRAAYPSASATDIYIRMLSVSMFGVSMFGMADKKARQPAPVFYYRFDYDTGLPPALGAFHTAELPLAMRMVLQPEAEGLSQRLAAAWANFARTGDPNGEGVPAWPRYDAATRHKMIFDRDVAASRAEDPEAGATRDFVELVLTSRG